MASKSLADEFPIHWLVWHNEHRELDRKLSAIPGNLEERDPRGRTPLHLAVTLGHIESARVLLKHDADCNAENSEYWSVLHEAVSSGDPEMVQLILKHRDHQRYTKRTFGVPDILQRLKESPDFYVEMKWEFTSWVPLVSRMCPSDTYRVWKSGSNVRIDTTLLGFDNMTWQRGSRSYVFKGSDQAAQVMEIDHDHRVVFSETMRTLPSPVDASLLEPSEDAVAARLTSPIVTTYVDTDKIAFERNKSGIWGWRSDKTETVSGNECKVFSACNVEVVTKTRTEHLTAQDKERSKRNNKTPLETFLGAAEEHTRVLPSVASNGEISTLSYNPSSITPEEYFNKHVELGERDIGRPREQTTKTQKFKATLWLCESYPLTLQEQVIPIIDLMAASNAHFAKLKDFITLQIPAGFPIKIEIPLFHVLNARITFGNIYGMDQPQESVSCVQSSDGSQICIIEDGCFEPPPGYVRQGDGHHERLRDEDDELLQFAIQQSLVEAGTENDQVTFWEALNKSRPPLPVRDEEDRQLQRAIEASLLASHSPSSCADESSVQPAPAPPTRAPASEEEEQLRLALEISQKQQEEEEAMRRQEEEELEKILQLSLTEK